MTGEPRHRLRKLRLLPGCCHGERHRGGTMLVVHSAQLDLLGSSAQLNEVDWGDEGLYLE